MPALHATGSGKIGRGMGKAQAERGDPLPAWWGRISETASLDGGLAVPEVPRHQITHNLVSLRLRPRPRPSRRLVGAGNRAKILNQPGLHLTRLAITRFHDARAAARGLQWQRHRP